MNATTFKSRNITVEIDLASPQTTHYEKFDLIHYPAKVTINGITRELKASEMAGRYMIHRVAVRYRTGEKVWNGSLICWTKSGHITLAGGLDNHRQVSLSLLGFYDDFSEATKSQHNGA